MLEKELRAYLRDENTSFKKIIDALNKADEICLDVNDNNDEDTAWNLSRLLMKHGQLDALKIFISKLIPKATQEWMLRVAMRDFYAHNCYLSEEDKRPESRKISTDEAKEFINWLLEQGADINNGHGPFWDFSTLHSAISANNVELVEFLISRGAFVYPVYFSQGQPSKIQELVEESLIVAQLKNECADYQKWLQGKIKHHQNENKYSERERVIIGLLNDLKPDNGGLIDNKKMILKFSERFGDGSIFDDETNKSADVKTKTFKRIVFTILSGGIYALYRMYNTGSPAFWKSKKDIFKDTVNEVLTKRQDR